MDGQRRQQLSQSIFLKFLLIDREKREGFLFNDAVDS